MIFILDQDIHFRPDDGAIWRINPESDKRFLTPSSCRVLVFFIEQQGQIVSRDDIFQGVWGKYGMHSSNNTLNQYISLLRRTLSDFGLEGQIIKTIPKAGFIFSPDVTITTDSGEVSCPSLSERSTKKRDIALSLLSIALIMLLIGVWRNRAERYNFSTVYQQSDNLQSCNVLRFSPHPGIRVLSSTNKLKYMAMIDDLAIECDANAFIVVQEPETVTNKEFAALCFTTNDKKQLSSCRGYYRYE